jgi:hypothetical protein
VVVDAEGSRKTNKTTLRSEWRGARKSVQKEKKKGLDGVSIVRDGRFADYTGVENFSASRRGKASTFDR